MGPSHSLHKGSIQQPYSLTLLKRTAVYLRCGIQRYEGSQYLSVNIKNRLFNGLNYFISPLFGRENPAE